jgi:hypothetical protein
MKGLALILKVMKAGQAEEFGGCLNPCVIMYQEANLDFVAGWTLYSCNRLQRY